MVCKPIIHLLVSIRCATFDRANALSEPYASITTRVSIRIVEIVCSDAHVKHGPENRNMYSTYRAELDAQLEISVYKPVC